MYLPSTEGIPIPSLDLPIPLLHRDAATCEDRKALFVYLGAIEPTIVQVRECILSSIHLSGDSDCVNKSNDALRYLYQTHGYGNKRISDLKSELAALSLHDASGQTFDAHEEDIYLQSNHAYNPSVLL